MLTLIIILAFLGAVLIGIEIFVPGMIVGIVGGLLLLGAVALTYFNYGSGPGDIMLILLLVLGGVFVVWWLSWLPNSWMARRWTLHRSIESPDEHPTFNELIGATGRALTPLRPGGTAMIGARRIDVVAESQMIEAGEEVRVLRTEGFKVVVQRLPSGDSYSG